MWSRKSLVQVQMHAIDAQIGRPHPSYNRLSRYDYSGLCWLLEGRSVTVLTETSALVENPATGTTTLFRKNHRPALGPLGDSLEDLK